MVAMKPSLGLYIHIPFCKAKCAYCDFYSLAHSEERMDAYVGALAAALRAAAPGAANHLVDTVYFGGGTPTVLGAKRLAALLDAVLRSFAVAPEAEITTEANPESARDADALQTLRIAGFNRVSLGMQSADDAELRAIGRIHTAADTAAAVDAARGYAQYEISNFARPGRESRHNLKYWTLGEYLGFGPGAHSDLGGRRFAVARDLDAFLAGRSSYSEDAAISPREREAERVMLGLRLTRGLSAAELAGAETVLWECAAHGLAERSGDRWRLTPRGFLVSNAVILRVQEALGL